jgi:ATP-dependent RNA helicase DDX60
MHQQEKKVHSSVQKSSKKPKELTSKEKLKAKIQADKDSKTQDESLTWWQDQLKLMEKMASATSRTSHLSVISRNPKASESFIALEMLVYQLKLVLDAWIAETDPRASEVYDRYTVSVMKQVKAITERSSWTSGVTKAIKSVVKALGFPSTLLSDATPAEDRRLSFDFPKVFKTSTGQPIYPFMALREHHLLWQLRLFGDYMDRSIESAPDPRVPFLPDKWQRIVLDKVDQKSSMLVVGKLVADTAVHILTLVT